MSFSKYPDSLDDSSSLPPSTDLVTPVKAEVTNRLRDAILALETELGIQPSSTFSTVRARLDSIDATITNITGKISVSANDQGLNFLENKIIAGDNIVISKLNVGGDEQIEISSTASGGGGGGDNAININDKGLIPSATSGNEQPTGITISDTPDNDSYVSVFVNGTLYGLGDGVKTDDCYFSNDSGVTARSIDSISSGDELYWNGVVSGFDLDANDIVDLIYIVS